MPYAAPPDRRVPYDVDGTVVGNSNGILQSVQTWMTSLQLGGLNSNNWGSSIGVGNVATTFFFPERKTVTALWYRANGGLNAFRGSNDTTNGQDGTWESASFPSGTGFDTSANGWRNSGWRACSFSIAYATVQIVNSDGNQAMTGAMIYGKKATGQTPDDVIFLDGDTSFTEYTTDKDWGDRPQGTTVVRSFQVKNVSSTKTANNVVLTLSDTDFNISTSNSGPWTTSITITALGAGATSATMFIKNTTPAIGSAALGPRYARLTAQVGSYT